MIFIGWKHNVIPMYQRVVIDETQLPRIISINSMIYVLIVHIYWILNRFYRKFERKNHFNIILMFHHVKQLKLSEQIDHHVKINESTRNHWILLQQEIKQEYNFIGKIFFEIVRQENEFVLFFENDWYLCFVQLVNDTAGTVYQLYIEQLSNHSPILSVDLLPVSIQIS